MSPKKYITFTVISFFLTLSACEGSFIDFINNQPEVSIPFSSYLDIPGITDEEIASIEAFQKQNKVFTYGLTLNSEMFEDANGQIKSYAALISKSLTEFFSIPFEVKLCDWNLLLKGLENGEISFTSELAVTPDRLKTFYMTDAITSNPLSYFRIAGSKPLDEISKSQPVRIVFLHGSGTVDIVSPHIDYEFEILFANSFNDAYNMLKNGEADAFIEKGVTDMIFDDMVIDNFSPLLYIPVSLATQNPEFKPIISVIQKLLKNGSAGYFTKLHSEWYMEYLKNKFLVLLTEEEKEYIRNNPVIPVAAEYYNYPICFYNKYEKQWQGIFFDVLQKTKELTGLSFKLMNDNRTEWPSILKLLESGEVYMTAELIPTKEREAKGFLWSSLPTMGDKYALLSKLSFPNITIRDIFSIRIGIPRGTAYEEQFKSWFPEHSKVTYYESTDAAFIALEHDELDMIMSSQRSLLAITNYHEYPGYKANLVFDQEAQSYFGFNKNQVILNSIFNKALSLIEIENISEQWALKTYDYKGKIMQAQRPWLIGVAILFFLMLVFVVSVFLKERSIGKANLQKAVAKAEAANNAKSTFLANMSHEIRTPMNAILSITEILAMQENVPAKIEDGLGRIYNSCNLLLGIINDILDFSKIEAGKLDIIPEEYNVASMISDSIQLNMIRIESKPIEFKIDIDENIPAKLIGDELRIKQILNNILSNAFKYTDSGDVILSVTFKEPCLEFRICDTGYGMTKEQLGRLFDEYVRFQGNNKGKTVQGTGLGMPITNRLVGLMGGEISVESEFGKGSQFIVRLPQKTVNDKVIGKGIADNLKRFRMNYIAYGRKSRITRKPMPYGKVLIVDDVEANLYVAVGLMKLYQLQIDTAMNGRSAIDKIKDEKKYDIVFMDHMMPEMDGIEAAKHIRKFGYTSPIIALTANAVVGQAEVFLQNGFDEFIAKPIDIRQLDSILNKFICEKHPEEAALVNHEEIKTETQSFHMLNIDIAGLNVLEGLRRYNDNEAMYLKVLRFYVTNISSMLNSIEAVSEDKLADYQITVHGIKGASLDIFAEYVGKSAKDLEMAAKSKDFSYIKAHNAQFIESTREFISELEGVLLAIDAENPKPKKEKPSAEILLELLNACKAYDINGVDLAMEEIEKYQYTADDGLANWLRENIDIMNFTQIVQKLTKLSN